MFSKWSDMSKYFAFAAIDDEDAAQLEKVIFKTYMLCLRTIYHRIYLNSTELPRMVSARAECTPNRWPLVVSSLPGNWQWNGQHFRQWWTWWFKIVGWANQSMLNGNTFGIYINICLKYLIWNGISKNMILFIYPDHSQRWFPTIYLRSLQENTESCHGIPRAL